MDVEHIRLRRQQTSLGPLVGSALTPLVAQSAREGIEIRVVAKDEPVVVHVDPEKVAWAVSMLVGNALRYLRPTATDIGGSILVEVGRTGSEAYVAVQDDGPGIPVEQLERLFERPKGGEHAPGLTLLLIRETVEAHGGRVELKSQSGEEDHFTCVTLFFAARGT